mgnify:CR=1 FL=1
MRGYGVNTGEIPENPIENTARSVRRAFREGIQIVEVDAVLKDIRFTRMVDQVTIESFSPEILAMEGQ